MDEQQSEVTVVPADDGGVVGLPGGCGQSLTPIEDGFDLRIIARGKQVPIRVRSDEAASQSDAFVAPLPQARVSHIIPLLPVADIGGGPPSLLGALPPFRSSLGRH